MATIGLVSLGCAKNAVDLQVMAGRLLARGHTLAPSPDCADAIIVNTCAFISAAREEAEREILRACALKSRGCARAVVVCGCFAQRYGNALAVRFPAVDAFLGIDALDSIDSIVSKALERSAGSSPVFKIPPGAPHRLFNPDSPALRFTGKAFAYLKIAEGCAHRCAYCAIPSIRGNCRSRNAEDILSEARALVETGVRELDIIAQDPLLWGRDFKGRRTSITDLLERIDGIGGDFKVRVLYAYPSEITDGFLSWMAESPRALKYVDVPLQHTVPEMLRAMNRGAAVEASLAAAARIRAAVPGATLRTTVMTGFPGETERRFERMAADLEEMDFDYLGVFAFSPEEGTPAASMPRRPSRAVAERRAAELAAMQSRRWRSKARRMTGREFPALVVAPGVARLESQAPNVDGVVFLENSAAKPGDVIRALLTGRRGYDFKGREAK